MGWLSDWRLDGEVVVMHWVRRQDGVVLRGWEVVVMVKLLKKGVGLDGERKALVAVAVAEGRAGNVVVDDDAVPPVPRWQAEAEAVMDELLLRVPVIVDAGQAKGAVKKDLDADQAATYVAPMKRMEDVERAAQAAYTSADQRRADSGQDPDKAGWDDVQLPWDVADVVGAAGAVACAFVAGSAGRTGAAVESVASLVGTQPPHWQQVE